MASFAEMIAGAALDSTKPAALDPVGSYMKGAELAQHAEQLQVAKKKNENDQETLQLAKLTKGIDYIQGAAKFDDAGSRAGYLRLGHTMLSSLGIDVPPEQYKFMTSSPENLARIGTVQELIRTQKLTAAQVGAVFTDAKFFSELPKDTATMLRASGFSPEALTAMSPEERAGILEKAGVASGLSISEQNKEVRAKELAGAKSGQQDVTNSAELRKEYSAHPITKRTFEITSSYNTLKSIADGKPSAAGDMSAVFAYMKMLDPGSTVREGEQAQARQAAGVPERILTQYNRLVDGESLSPAQRKDFFHQAQKLYNAQIERQGSINKRYEQIARKQGANPSLVVSEVQRAEGAKSLPKLPADKLLEFKKKSPEAQQIILQKLAAQSGKTPEEVKKGLGL